MASLKFYGKKTCVSCQKAQALLDEVGVEYEMHAIETEPPEPKLLAQLMAERGVKASLNSRSKIYKDKALGRNLPDAKTALKLMREDPNLIKRPVIVNTKGEAVMGFDADQLRAFLGR